MKKPDKDFELALEKHLRREELIFRAKHSPSGSCVNWLAPSCESIDDIVGMLRWLGFRVKEIVDDKDCTGAECSFVVTTSGVIVFVNDKYSRGLVSGRGY